MSAAHKRKKLATPAGSGADDVGLAQYAPLAQHPNQQTNNGNAPTPEFQMHRMVQVNKAFEKLTSEKTKQKPNPKPSTLELMNGCVFCSPSHSLLTSHPHSLFRLCFPPPHSGFSQPDSSYDKLHVCADSYHTHVARWLTLTLLCACISLSPSLSLCPVVSLIRHIDHKIMYSQVRSDHLVALHNITMRWRLTARGEGHMYQVKRGGQRERQELD